MNNKTTLIILSAITVVTTVYVGYTISAIEPTISNLWHPYEARISPQYFDGVTSVTNATQGTTVHLNVTFKSYSEAKLAIPIENFSLVWHDENVSSSSIGPIYVGKIIPGQEKVFNYSLSLNRITLEPEMGNSSILSVNFADNAPVGRYVVTLEMGECEFLSPSEKQGRYTYSIDLCFVVNPSG